MLKVVLLAVLIPSSVSKTIVDRSTTGSSQSVARFNSSYDFHKSAAFSESKEIQLSDKQNFNYKLAKRDLEENDTQKGSGAVEEVCVQNVTCLASDTEHNCCLRGSCCFHKNNPKDEIETEISKLADCHKCHQTKLCCPEQFCCLSEQNVLGVFGGVAIWVEIVVVVLCVIFCFGLKTFIGRWELDRKEQIRELKKDKKNLEDDDDDVPTFFSSASQKDTKSSIHERT